MLVIATELFDTAYLIKLTATSLQLILQLSAPMLIAAIGTGLAVSIFQATTQIQEQTLSFVPKIIATFVAIILYAPQTSSKLMHFARNIFSDIASMGPG